VGRNLSDAFARWGRAKGKTASKFGNQEHLFTPQEAAKLLPDLKPRLRDLMERKKLIESLKTEVERYNLIGTRTTEGQEKARLLDTLAEDMMSRITELEDLGVQVRDIDFGLVDFPAERFGERVFLCWRYGEPDIGYWHKPDEGFGGRKALKSQLISP
jgi:hypothetical protein